MACSRHANSTCKGPAEGAAAPHIHSGQAEFMVSVQEWQAGAWPEPEGSPPTPNTWCSCVPLSEAQGRASGYRQGEITPTSLGAP